MKPIHMNRMMSIMAILTAWSIAAAVPTRAADFNGDGYDDQAIGMSNEDIAGYENAGAVQVLYGTPSGLAATTQFWTQNTAGIPSSCGEQHAFGMSLGAGDFNGDGFDDLAIGANGDKLAVTQRIKGVITVLYGSAGGLTAAGNQIVTTDTIGVDDDIVNIGTYGFGRELESGDFNNDGFDELVIGTRDATMTTGVNYSGVVHVVPGSAQGLRRNQAREWTQNSPGVLNLDETNDKFGLSLATGDFNGDDYEDLAIGSQETLGAATEAGAVHVLYGSAAGLTAANDQMWYQSAPGIADSGEASDGFGSALVSGDFDNDGFDDLGIGADTESRLLPGTATNLQYTGIVHVMYGGSGGLSAAGSQEFWQGTDGIASTPAAGERFGCALAAGDYNGDGRDDLAIGAYAETLNGGQYRGAVHVLYGTALGLRTTNSDFWHQDSPGIAETAEDNEYFGDAVVAGDFDGNGRDDLAISVNGEQVGSYPDEGAMHVLYGSVAGLTSIGSQFWHQNTAGIPNACEANDYFASTLCK